MSTTKPVAVDEMAPWTIKSFSTDARQRIVRAAEIQGVTVGQFIEKLLEDWEASGSENRVYNPVSPANGHDRAPALALALNAAYVPKWLRAGAARLLAGDLGIDIPKTRPGPRRRLAAPEGAGEGG
jgi:hypothetical protein